MSQKVLHKRSSAVVNGQPKLPTPEQMEYGEIAINFAKGYETFSILNTESGITTFSSDDVINAKIESNSGQILSTVSANYATTGDMESAVTRINANEENISNLSGIVSSVSANYATTGDMESAVTRINANEENISNLSGIVSSISSTYAEKELVIASAINDIIEQIEDNELVVAAAINDHISDSDAHLPQVTSSDNGKILKVVNGHFALVSPVTVYSGEDVPSGSLGNNGDIYLQTS